MRPVTRNFLAGVLVVLVLLLALGALPGLLKSGGPYYVTATPVSDGVDASNSSNGSQQTVDVPNSPKGSQEAVDAATLSSRSYPYTTAALADASTNATGQSDPYWTGPVGFKEAFTHSPFDEMTALRQRHPNATTGEEVTIVRNGTLYRVAVTP